MARVTTEIREETVDAPRSERVVTQDVRESSNVVVARIVWFVTGVIVSLLALRVVLQLLGANQGNAVVDLIYGVSGVFAMPFFGMFSYEPSYGVSYLEVSTLAAMFIYALIGWGIVKLLTIGRGNTAQV